MDICEDSGAVVSHVCPSWADLIERRALMDKSEIDQNDHGHALKISDDLFDRVCEMTKVGGWELDLQSGKLFWSLETYRIHEVDPQVEPSVAAAQSFYSPDIKSKLEAMVQAGIEHGTPWDYELPMTTARGRNIWVRGQGTVTIENGKIIKLIGSFQDISDRKRVEEALRQNKHRLELATSSVSLGIWDWDIINNNMAWDDQMYRLYGVTDKKSATGVELWQKGLHPDDFAYAWEECQAALRGEKKYDIEFRVKHPDGTVKFIKADGTVLRDENGKAVRMLGVNRDITESKLAEVQLKEIEALMRIAIEHLQIIFYMIDHEGKFRLSVGAGLKGLGLEQNQVVGLSAFEIYKDFPEIINAIQATLSGKAATFESHVSGSTYFNTCVPFSTPGSGFSGLVAVALDITDRKKAAEAISAEKERLAVTLRSIGDGVITTDTLGNVVIMNKVAEDLCGWKQEEAQGKPLASVFNIINQSTRTPHENPVEKVLSTGLIIELANHTLLISRDGTERIIADSGAPIKDKESKTIGVVLVFRDMTEKHRLLDNMQRIDKLDSLGVLAGGIAHDFNNLLAGIFGYLDMARARSVTDTTVSKYLDKAATVFERAKDLTQQLLTFSKGGVPKRKTGQLGKLVKENAAFVLSGTNVICDFHIAQDLWLADFDENQIGQVIDNIVLNAQQAMPVGGTIVIAMNNHSLKDNDTLTLKAGNYIKVSITDTGVGIPENLLKRIFDPFFTTKQKGNGLGLATCYSIVQKHDGYIDIESVPGKGSTFHIYLPAANKGTLPDISPSTSQHKGKGSILVMDDEKFMREIVGDMLADMGYTLIEAENGEEALRLCAAAKKQGTQICAALFDLTIPGGMGGKETIVKFREQFPEIPVFASSGFSEDPSMARPTEFGFTDSIRKPFKINELAEMLNKHLLA